MRSTFAIAGAAALLLSASISQASSITFDGTANTTGNGNGTVVGVLSLQAKPSDNGVEWGGTGWDGSTHTFTNAGDSQNKTANGNATYQALSPADLSSIGLTTLATFLSNFAVTFQVGEGNGTLTLQQLEFSFYNGTTGTDLLDSYYPGPGATDHTTLTLNGTGQGTAGYIFTMHNLTSAEMTALNTWWNSGGYFGISVNAAYPVTESKGEADDFFVANINNNGITSIPGTPLPAGASMGMALLGGLGLVKLARRRKNPAA